MKKLLLIISILLVSFYYTACDKEKENGSNSEKNKCIIIIKNYNDKTVSIYKKPIYRFHQDKKHFFIKKSLDTLSLYLKEGEEIFASVGGGIKDSIIACAGDTLFLLSTESKLQFRTKEINEIVKLNLKTSLIDSLLKNEYSFYSNKKSVQNKKSLSNKKNTSLIHFSNILINRYLHINNIYDTLSFYSPYLISRYKILKDNTAFEAYSILTYLYTISNDSYLKDFINKSFFSNPNILENRNAYNIIDLYIKNILLLGKKKTYGCSCNIDYVGAFYNIDKCLENKKIIEYAKFLCIDKSRTEDYFKTKLSALIVSFKRSFPESKLNARLKEFEKIYNINLDDYYTDDIQLIDNRDQSLYLKDLIKKYKGKVIYLDIWASWCTPCKMEIPHSLELSKEFKNKDIVFIYLSIDRYKDNWILASKKQNINNRISFLAINFKKSNLYRDLNINTIPRFMIFNKMGKIKYANAPRPSSNDIKQILNNCL
ncbi:TlpA family protein disulfide reductase [Marinilabiliaceae bacterium JC040]|nr:TlpA family protein disulfide reductase [Marinilabiliaceae bacterium JC040]